MAAPKKNIGYIKTTDDALDSYGANLAEIPFSVLRDEIYSNAYGIIKTMTGRDRTGAAAFAMDDFDPVKMEDGDRKNLYVSAATYKTPLSAKKDNINSVLMILIDVDCYETILRHDKKPLSPVDKYAYLRTLAIERYMKHGIGFIEPSCVECSRGFRLYYCLTDPFVVRYVRGQKRNNALKVIEYVGQAIAADINSLDARFHAEAQKLTSYIRAPYSVNVRTERVEDGVNCYGEKLYRYRAASRDTVRLFRVGDKNQQSNITTYNFQDLCDYFLPRSQEEAEAYQEKLQEEKKKQKSARKSGKTAKTRKKTYSRSYLYEREKFLKTLPDKGYDIGYRERIIFHLTNVLLTLGLPQSEIVEKAQEVNDCFSEPLRGGEFRCAIAKKVYKYKDKTFYNEFGVEIPDQVLEHRAKNRAKSKAASERARRSEKRTQLLKEGKAPSQIRDRIRNTKAKLAKKLRATGETILSIAEKLKISRRSVYNYLSLQTIQTAVNPV